MSKERIISLLNKAETNYKSYIVIGWLLFLTVWINSICSEQDRRAVSMNVIEKSLELRR